MGGDSQVTILIVEDQESVRRLVRQVLDFLGYRVLEAANAVDALRICENHAGTIDARVADFHLPDMNRVHLANRVNSLRSDIKVLLVSGDDEHVIESAGGNLTGLAFLAKLYTQNDLTAKLNEVLGI